MSQSAITKLETPPVSSPEGLAVSLGAVWDVSCGLGIAPTFGEKCPYSGWGL